MKLVCTRLMLLLAAGTFTTGLSAAPEAFNSDAESAESAVIGTVEYRGGFSNRYRVTLDAPTTLSKFSVAIPGYCTGVEILEAGTVTEGIEDLASRAARDPRTFLVNNGQGARVSAVFVTLNGPLDASCVIPIIDSEAPTPDGCSIEVLGTNSYASTAYPSRTGWNEATIRRFVNSASWSRPLMIDLAAGDRGFTLTQPNGSCHTYSYIKYDPAACGSDFVAPGAATLVGEVRTATETGRLFGLLSTRNTWNVCVHFRNGIPFSRAE